MIADPWATASRAYLEGLLGLSGARLDGYLIEARYDGPKKCSVGIACGSTCISRGKVCRAKGSPAAMQRLGQLLALPPAGGTSGASPEAVNRRQRQGDLNAAKQRASEEFQEAFRKGDREGGMAKLMETVRGASAPRKETLQQLRKAVLAKFNVKSAAALGRNKNFRDSMAGDDHQLNWKDRETWAHLHRRFVGVPMSERNLKETPGGTVIRGIDVTKNFRPWVVFNLDPKTATREQVNRAYKELARKHHPDHGGNPEAFQAITRMRNSVLALMR